MFLEKDNKEKKVSNIPISIDPAHLLTILSSLTSKISLALRGLRRAKSWNTLNKIVVNTAEAA